LEREANQRHSANSSDFPEARRHLDIVLAKLPCAGHGVARYYEARTVMNPQSTTRNRVWWLFAVAATLLISSTSFIQAAVRYNLARDFGTNSNPSGVWSYGWQSSITGSFHLVNHSRNAAADNGVPFFVWEVGNMEAPIFEFFPFSNTAVGTSDGGQGKYPPGAVVYYAGADGSPYNFATIRFTAPTSGVYRLGVRARHYLEGPTAGDVDFHIIKASTTVLQSSLFTLGSATYTNRLRLEAGETIDFAVGRGVEDSQYGSGIRVQAMLTLLQADTPPPPPPPVESNTLVVPSHYTHTDAGAASGSGILRFINHYQDVYGASHFSTNPIRITELRFRPSAVYGFPFQTVISNFQVSLGVTPAQPGNLSHTFANNRGSNSQIVFEGPLAISSAFSGPAEGPKAFDISVPLQTPFDYDPARGNLLVEIRNYSGSGAAYVDAGPSPDDDASRAFADDPEATQARTVDSGAEIIQLRFTPLTNSVPPVSTNSPLPLPSGAAAWWRLEGDGADSSGNGIALTLSNNATLGTGHVGQALSLQSAPSSQASHGFVGAGRLNLGTNEGLTIELWVKPDDVNQHQPLLEWSDAQSVVGLHLWISKDGPGSLFANVIDQSGAPHHLLSGAGHVSANEFTHVAMTYSRESGFVRLYANGQEVAASNVGTLIPETRPALYVGWRPIGGEWRFNGKLDEITLYRRALAAEEIAAIHQAGTAGKTNSVQTPRTAFSISEGFGREANPAGVWSYGWKSNFTSQLSLLTHVRSFGADNGAEIRAWELGTFNPPVVAKVVGPHDGFSDGGNFTAPAGTIYFAPGADNTPQNFGVIRFTAPAAGTYEVVTSVSQLFSGARSADSDFHVITNGVELFGAFLAPNQGTNFAGTVTLNSGDVVEFAVGRGADGQTYDSGLKISAALTLHGTVATNPPPVATGNFHAVRDFSLAGNPNGAWSYGWQSSVTGAFNLVTYSREQTVNSGISMLVWELAAGAPPHFIHFPLTNTATSTSDGGHGQYPPGTLVAVAGTAAPHNLATLRFTSPSNAFYRVVVTARAHLDGGPASDTDFHITHNGVELLGENLPALGHTAYSNVLWLASGDTLDLATGRGLDDVQYGSALKISAVVTPTEPGQTNAPAALAVQQGAGGSMTLSLPRGTYGNYIVEGSSDLQEWEKLGNVICVDGQFPAAFALPKSSAPQKFFRVRLSNGD
jgi:hypothetical protein